MKTASVKARALEGLLGSVLGSGVGAAGGAAFYEPKQPREWMDEQGNVYGRPLTTEEKKARRQFVAQAALLGAVGGAGLSLGSSSLVAKRLAKVEREAAQEAVQDYLEPFRSLIGEYKTHLAKHAPGGKRSKLLQRRVGVAESLLKKQEGEAVRFVDEAMRRRAHLPFRGKLHPADSGAIDWRQYSAASLVDQHFDDLAKQHGYPPIFSQPPRTARDAASAEEMAKDVFHDMVTKAMTKTSEAAYRDELQMIASVG